MAVPKVVKPEIETKEEVGIIAMYKEMLGRIEEINKLSLGMESSDDLAAMLKDTEMVKAKIVGIMDKMIMQAEMDKAVEVFESKSDEKE